MVGSWLGIVFGLIAIATVVLAVIAIYQRMKPFTATRLASIGALLILADTTVVTTLKILTCFIPGGVVQVKVSSVAPFWPTLPESLNFVGNAPARVVHGGFQMAEVGVVGASLTGRLEIALSALAMGVVIAALCIAVRQIAKAVETGDSFRDVSAKWLRRCAWIVLFAGSLASVFDVAGSTFIAHDLTATNYGYKDQAVQTGLFQGNEAGLTHQVFGMVQLVTSVEGFPFDVWPVLAAIVLLILARVFDQGKKLQIETDGLI